MLLDGIEDLSPFLPPDEFIDQEWSFRLAQLKSIFAVQAPLLSF